MEKSSVDRLGLFCIFVAFAQQMVSTTAFVTVTITRTIPANGGESDRAFVHQMTTYSDSRWCSEENMLILGFKLHQICTAATKRTRKVYKLWQIKNALKKNIITNESSKAHDDAPTHTHERTHAHN